MSLDGFLTFIGLMIAAYAVMEPISRLRLTLDLKMQVWVAVFAGVAVLLLEFQLPIFSLLPTDWSDWVISFPFGGEDDLLNNQELAFAVVIIWISTAIFLFSKSKPRLRKIPRLSSLVGVLLDQGRFYEVIKITEPYLPIVEKILSRKFRLQVTHDWLAKRAGKKTTVQILNRYKVPSVVEPIRWLYKGLTVLAPSHKKEREAAEKIISSLMNSNQIRRELLRENVNYAVNFVTSRTVSRSYYFDMYMSESVSTEGSHFRREVPKNDNIYGCDYYLDPNNVLLTGLLADLSFAKECSLWKPIGDTALRLIKEEKPYREALNSPIPLDDVKKHADPVFCTIHFFDIMVKRAAVNGIKYHMWLMYVGYIIEALSENFDFNAKTTDGDAEFPNLGCWLIFEGQLRLGDWVSLSHRLPPENVHLVPSSVKQAETMGNIPYWAARELCRSTGILVKNRELPRRFRVERVEQYMRVLVNIPKEGKCSYLRKYMADSLKEELSKSVTEESLASYRKLFEDVDPMLKFEAPELASYWKK